MSAFRLFAYLMPLLVAIAVPALLSWGRVSPRRWVVPAFFGGFAVVLFAAWLASENSFGAFLAVLCLSASMGVLSAGLFLSATACRLSASASQIIACLVVCALTGSVFALGPVVRNAQDVGMGGEGVAARISLAVAASPYTVLAYSVFEDEALERPILYATDARDYPFQRSSWGWTSLGYTLAGLLLFGVYFGVRMIPVGKGG